MLANNAFYNSIKKYEIIMDDLSTDIQNLFIEHYKTLLKKIIENLDKWRENYLGGSADSILLRYHFPPNWSI